MYPKREKPAVNCVYNTGNEIFNEKEMSYYSFLSETPRSVLSVSKECKPFDMRVPISKKWKKSKNRMLFVCQHVHTEDLKTKTLLSAQSGTLLKNLLNYSKKLAVATSNIPQDFAYAAVNFNFFKSYHLSPAQQKELNINSINAKRVRRFIQKTRPTHVFFSGCEAAYAILGDSVPNIEHKMGWVIDAKIDGLKVKVCSSFDFVDAISDKRKRKEWEDDEDDDSGDDAGLEGAFSLGYFARCLRNALIDKIPHEINLVPKGEYVDTIEKFDAMMKVLNKAQYIAVDTEAQNLNKIKNKTYTLQFAVKKSKGYVLPYLHGMTPFSSDELAYIRKKLRAFFSQKIELSGDIKKARFLLMFNGKFDLSLLRNEFGIRVYHWPLWDIQAGEYLLDENLKFIGKVAKVGSKKLHHGNLAQLLANYGCDFYYTSAFSKADRGDMDNTDITSQAFINYAAMDAQCLIAMFEQQLKRAKQETHMVNGQRVSYLKDYCRMNLCQMSNIIHDFSVMEYRGTNVDRRHLLYLKTKQSPISQSIYKARNDLYALKSVKEANKFLLKEKNVQSNSLFGEAWAFNIDKPYHKQVLYIKVLGLEPITYGKSGEPSLGKIFKKTYKDTEEVKILEALEKVKKLKTSYVNAFIKFLSEGDGAADGRIRPKFDFFPVVTGRSNSSKPSLQQIPQRGDNAKHLKRVFAAGKGKIKIKQDYSAHEIRCWSIISLDKVLGSVFMIGRKLRSKFFKTGKEKYKKEIALKGDVHKLNQNFFFGTPIKEITPEQRDGIKAVGFGAIYGKSVSTLAKDLKKAIEIVQELVDKYFGRYKKASNWLKWAKSFSEKYLFVNSPIGRRRYLFGYLTQDNRIVAAMQRRAMNSPIQGMAADFGHTASRLFSIEFEKVLTKLKRITEETEKMPSDIEVMVHDSMQTEVDFQNVLIAVHLLQWCATQGVVDYYGKHFGLKFSVIPEVDMEFGMSEDKMYNWNWSLTGKVIQKVTEGDKEKFYVVEYVDGKEVKKRIKGNDELEADESFPLDYCIHKTAEDYIKMYPEHDITAKKIVKTIYSDWENSKIKAYLDKKYPILAEWECEI